MKKLLSLLAVLGLFTASYPQDNDKLPMGWSKSIVGVLNLTQTQFDNWSQGGENSLAWQTNLNAEFIKNDSGYTWTNTGKFSYGKIKVGDQDARKSIDEIKLESVYMLKIPLFLKPYLSASAETQSTTGYKYVEDEAVAISKFLNPAYFYQSLGLGYVIEKRFKTRLGIALKETYAPDYPELYSDDPTTEKIEELRFEVGAESSTSLKQKLTETTLVDSELQLFSNLQRFDEIDIRWNTLFSTKVSDYININFNFILFYDKDISKKRQIKQSLALGLTYTFL